MNLSKKVLKKRVFKQKILDEHSSTQNQMETELNNLDNAGIRAGGKSYGMEIARGIHPTNIEGGHRRHRRSTTTNRLPHCQKKYSKNPLWRLKNWAGFLNSKITGKAKS